MIINFVIDKTKTLEIIFLDLESILSVKLKYKTNVHQNKEFFVNMTKDNLDKLSKIYNLIKINKNK